MAEFQERPNRPLNQVAVRINLLKWSEFSAGCAYPKALFNISRHGVGHRADTGGVERARIDIAPAFESIDKPLLLRINPLLGGNRHLACRVLLQSGVQFCDRLVHVFFLDNQRR